MPQKSIRIGRLSTLVGYYLRRASSAFAIDFRDAVGETGMRQVLVGVLAVVEANPGVKQGAVGVALGIKPANMVSLTNELVDQGLIERVVTPRDRRAFALSITAAGTALLSDCFDRIRRHEERMLDRLTEEERATLLDLIARVQGADTDQ
ncbi:MAG: MarR family transcriptional regulator [Sphingomonas sp.]|uniref:MarR family winged helix-turn-helix transcriptional regulator n=1 Tax=Sphingomonas sp. TaxID=28214 RepID=UPI001AD4071E|nr:MarR family transcriptional regulator [Sphingomonas sp.]MBN8816802.1 MarR family transcriptional regulator [Sphingomonas sp.]